ncbi:methylenetetrahydrofolate reductase-like, partial [Argonauta hians]
MKITYVGNISNEMIEACKILSQYKLKHKKTFRIVHNKITEMFKTDSQHHDNEIQRKKTNFIPLIDQMKHRSASNEYWFSLEFFPPRTIEGVKNMVDMMKDIALSQPLFCDMTWHIKNEPQNLDDPTSSLCMASKMLNYLYLPTMLHITSRKQSVAEMKKVLEKAKSQGIRNILALSGDRLPDEVDDTVNEIPYAADLVRLIRQQHGNHFVIAVAGYPNGHPDCTSYEEDIQHLKEKVDAGADFVITQLFFQSKTFEKYIKDCREVGISCPIIPGILPIQSYKSLSHISKLAALPVPEDILQTIELIKDNNEAICNFGIHHAVELGKELLNSSFVQGLHFYTLNKQNATRSILKQLGLLNEEIPKPLPWKPSVNYKRLQEEIRPIFWKARPNSYICRTSNWNKFPSGKWSNSSLSSFGKLNDFYMLYIDFYCKKQLKSLEYQLNTEQDVWDLFYYLMKGDENQSGVKITHLPWNEDVLSPETYSLDRMAFLNKNGILIINSQPEVNGLSSNDRVFGWGKPNGYVYQKAYLEFFISKKNVEILKKILPNYPQVNYHIVNSQDDLDDINYDVNQPITVTWGIFPGLEIIQPFVVDPLAFKIWKEEAFSLWKIKWRDLYDPNSNSYKLINHFYENYQLVNLVDNDFLHPTCLWEITTKIISGEIIA